MYSNIKVKLYNKNLKNLDINNLNKIVNKYIILVNADYKKLDNIIFTDDFNKSSLDFYGIENKTVSNGCTTKLQNDKYVIYLKFDNCFVESNNEYIFSSYWIHFLVHELTHFFTNTMCKYPDNPFEGQNSEKEFSFYLAKLFFLEFNAEYNAQRLYPVDYILFDNDMDELIAKNDEIISKIDNHIELDNSLLVKEILIYSKKIIYTYALSTARECADIYIHKIKTKLNLLKNRNGIIKEELYCIDEMINNYTGSFDNENFFYELLLGKTDKTFKRLIHYVQ